MFLRQTQQRRTLRMTPPRARASYLCRPPQPVCGGGTGAVRAGRGPDCATGGACRRRQVGGAVRPDAPAVPPGWIVGMGDRTRTYVTRSARHGEATGKPGDPEYVAKAIGSSGYFTSVSLDGNTILAVSASQERHGNRKCLPGSVQSRTARSALIGRPIASEVPPGARMHLFGAHSSFTRARLSSLRARRRFGA